MSFECWQEAQVSRSIGPNDITQSCVAGGNLEQPSPGQTVQMKGGQRALQPNRLRRLIDWLCDNWKRPDEGIWEVRGGRRQFVYSKLMCWVAVDRSLRLAEKRSRFGRAFRRRRHSKLL